MHVNIAPRIVALFLFVPCCVMTLLHLLIHFTNFVGQGRARRVNFWYRFFDMDQEFNLGSWYSTGLLLFCAVLLALHAVAQRPMSTPHTPSKQPSSIPYAFLSLVFFYLSLDEMVGFHELLKEPLKFLLIYLPEGMPQHLLWIVPASAITLLIFLLTLRFLITLPRKIAMRMVLSGAIYLAGAVGFEILGGSYYSRFRQPGTQYILYSALEEFLEMSGVILFIYCLLDQLGNRSVTIGFTPSATPTEQTPPS